jgi:hypothetical protein
MCKQAPGACNDAKDLSMPPRDGTKSEHVRLEDPNMSTHVAGLSNHKNELSIASSSGIALGDMQIANGKPLPFIDLHLIT